MNNYVESVLSQLKADTKTSQVKEAVRQLKKSIVDGKRTLHTCYVPEMLCRPLSYSNDKLSKELGLSVKTVDTLLRNKVKCLYQMAWSIENGLKKKWKMSDKGIEEVKSALERYGLRLGCIDLEPFATKQENISYIEVNSIDMEQEMLSLWTSFAYIDWILEYAETQVPNTWRTIMQIEPTDKKTTQQGVVGRFWDMF